VSELRVAGHPIGWPPHASARHDTRRVSPVAAKQRRGTADHILPYSSRPDVAQMEQRARPCPRFLGNPRVPARSRDCTGRGMSPGQRFVYVLTSEKDRTRYYIGLTSNMHERLIAHNEDGARTLRMDGHGHPSLSLSSRRNGAPLSLSVI